MAVIVRYLQLYTSVQQRQAPNAFKLMKSKLSLLLEGEGSALAYFGLQAWPARSAAIRRLVSAAVPQPAIDFDEEETAGLVEWGLLEQK